MADEPEPAAKPSRRRPREKPVSLYPLTLEEAVDRLLKAKGWLLPAAVASVALTVPFPLKRRA